MAQPDRRPMSRLKIEAREKGLTREEVQQFGSLARRESWEKAIAFRDATTQDFAAWIEPTVNDTRAAEPSRSPSFLSYINFSQLVALILVAAGFFALVLPILWRIPSPFPIKIHIQIGASK